MQTSRSYRLDFERKRIFAAGSVKDIEAIRQFIRKTLVTPRFRCLVYDNQYGSELNQTITVEDASRAFILTEIPRLVRDALLVDSRILEVYSFDIEFNVENCYIAFTARTVYGILQLQEVI